MSLTKRILEKHWAESGQCPEPGCVLWDGHEGNHKAPGRSWENRGAGPMSPGMTTGRRDGKPIFYAQLAGPMDTGERPPLDPIHHRLIEELFEPNELRTYVITLHLYVEYWLLKLLKALSEPVPWQFSHKVKALQKRGALDPSLHENIVLINQLRNVYAHTLKLEEAESKVAHLVRGLKVEPRFRSTDPNRFRTVCVQTILALEAIFNNGGQPPERTHPAEAVRAKLLAEQQLHWQSCEIIQSEPVGEYITDYHLRCPLCGQGTIVRSKDDTPGFRESDMTACGTCGLTGDGAFVRLETAKPEFRRSAPKRSPLKRPRRSRSR